MNRLVLICASLVTLAIPSLAANAVGVRIVFGLDGKLNDKWDGSVTAQGARVTAVEPWRFDLADQILPGNAWKASLHPIRAFAGAQRPGQKKGQLAPVANGVVVFLDSANDSVVLNVHTAQGDFRTSLRDLAWGAFKAELNGQVLVDRVPGVEQITTSTDEEDFPAAASGKDGSVWVAYLAFKHAPDALALRSPIKEAPKNFDQFTERPGGDQVFVRRYANGSWGTPIAVSDPGGDLWRPSVAVDGRGRAWVFWSANKVSTYDGKGVANYDIFARMVENGAAGRTIQLTSEAGSDVDPVAATDSAGRVWVAWQGWRRGRATIQAAIQQGDSFGKAATVSSSEGNEWNPSITADKTGRVAVAWDSYRNGNYDVFARTATASGAWGNVIPVATSPRYEAYPSASYDASGRLWVAYEEGAEGWGKDFGAYDTTGVALYQGRAIRVRVMEPDGRWTAPAVDPGTVLTGTVAPRLDRMGTQNQSDAWLTADPNRAKNRQPNGGPTPSPAPRNTSPRLLADESGRVWLAYRTPHPTWWHPLGTVWTEYVVSADGSGWSKPVYLHHSDNLLDNRPALASVKGGELMVIGSSDHRRELPKMGPNLGPAMAIVTPDAEAKFNNDLYISTLSFGAAGAAPAMKAITPASASGAPEFVAKERQTIANMRALRTPDGLRMIRGEFHRHSEISPDGGGDGTIIDQFRYAIDTAGLDWVGCCDHDNGQGREYTWWITQKLTDILYAPGAFVPMFSYERSVSYPEGHRNVIFAQRGVRTLPRMPKVDRDAEGHAPDTQMLYKYLRQYNGIVASHTSGTTMGTDWRDNDPVVEPIVEIYQGDRQNYEVPGGPRSNSAGDSIGGWEPKGFVSLAFDKGYMMSFQASSDHISTHLSYCNILAKDSSRAALLDAVKARHVYGSTENITADFRSGAHMMGDAFQTNAPPVFNVKLNGTKNFKKVYVVKNNKYVYTLDPGKPVVEFTWRDNESAPGTSFYYVRGEQEDGNIVWVSPMWVTR